jgi:hypothetical protein
VARIYTSRAKLPPLPRLHQPQPVENMAAFLGMSARSLRAKMRDLGLDPKQWVCIAHLRSLTFTKGRAGKLLGRSSKTLERWIASRKIIATKPTDGYDRISLGQILTLREAMRRSPRRRARGREHS